MHKGDGLKVGRWCDDNLARMVGDGTIVLFWSDVWWAVRKVV